MKLLSCLSPKVWLIIAYTILTAAFIWAGQQTEASVAGWVFFGSLAVSWIPIFVYQNREEIVRDKAYWLSHAAAAAVGVSIFVLWTWWLARNESHERQSSWIAIIASVIAYMVTMQSGFSIVAWLVRKTQTKVESALEPKHD
jgi:uncharacterized protein YqgC (DUF456 family)